jgi:hypothetical protein
MYSPTPDDCALGVLSRNLDIAGPESPESLFPYQPTRMPSQYEALPRLKIDCAFPALCMGKAFNEKADSMRPLLIKPKLPIFAIEIPYLPLARRFDPFASQDLPGQHIVDVLLGRCPIVLSQSGCLLDGLNAVLLFHLGELVLGLLFLRCHIDARTARGR